MGQPVCPREFARISLREDYADKPGRATICWQDRSKSGSGRKLRKRFGIVGKGASRVGFEPTTHG